MSRPFPWDLQAGVSKRPVTDADEGHEGDAGPSTEEELKLAAQRETWSDMAEAISRLTELEEEIASEKEGNGSNNARTSELIKQTITAVRGGNLPTKSGPLAFLLYEPIDLNKGRRPGSDFTKVPSSIESCENGTAAISLATLWNDISRRVETVLANKSDGSFTSTIQAASSHIGRRLRAGSLSRERSLQSMVLEIMTYYEPISKPGDSSHEETTETGSIGSDVFDWPEEDGAGGQSGHDA
jgi:hypothetical protein